MQTPQNTLASAKDRAAEITWWNRRMTKLNQVNGITNAQSFVENDLIEQKGPYVEFVDAPEFHDQPASEFLKGLGYRDEIIDAVNEELFGGKEGSLYQHQAEMIEQIETTDRDNVLAVPTATGKTEAFFFPILNHCLSTQEDGLKSIILYPMKTLGVDQLNRFIAYLDQINRYRNSDERITIGIWDGDTPTRVGTRDHEVEPGSYIRGLEDPRNPDDKLRVLGETNVGTDDNQYPWIRVTRDSIRRGVDILLTVPEALDYMFISDNDETRDVLGNTPGEHPVEHIVFDEAHVWSGIQGAAVSLLSRRLKHFYDDRDPQISMVSATVDNPRELASSLTGTEEDEINTIGFTGRDFPTLGEPEFGRFSPCDIADLVHVLALAVGDIDDPTSHLREYDLEDALSTAREVGLVADEKIEIETNIGEWATDAIKTRLLSLARTEFDDVESVLNSVKGRNELVEAVIDESGTNSGWYEYVLTNVPEVAAFATWFETDTTGVVGFKSYDQLLTRARNQGVEDPEGVIETVMAFGRLAGVVTEKYHVFLKPPYKVYWCRECEKVFRDSRCPECNRRLPEVQFCRRCHEPYVEIDPGNGDEEFAPISVGSPVDSCPGCEKWVNLTDAGVPTSSLLSYMLTEVCRHTPSKKTLVFSDSHSSAESVGDRIIDTEYGLMAETLYLQELIEAGGKKDNYELFNTVSTRLREEYWEPLIQNEIDEDGTAYNFLRSLLDDIESHAMLHNCESLLDGGLVTADVVADLNDPEELVLAHEIYKLFTLGQGASFTYKKVSIDGLTREKLIDRLESRTQFTEDWIDERLNRLLSSFLEDGIITEQPLDEVKTAVRNANLDDGPRKQVKAYIESAREQIESAGIMSEPPESGVFTRIPRIDNSSLELVETAAFCADCYSAYPATNDGRGVEICHNCGASLETYRRFTRGSDGELTADPGYAQVESGWDYAIDHWAHDVTRPLTNGGEPEFITVGIHKSNIPHTLRGAIEEGFRKDDPDVNIVSATPTMELGVDIGTLDTVAQVGVPPTLTNYVQRSGRTGRSRGSSSLVMTVIRGNHPVDGHYYANLDSFLNDFEPVRVPDPNDFDELVAGHVVTEVFAYLARNPHESGVFERMYALSEPKHENMGSFVSAVEKNLDILQRFIRDEMWDTLSSYIREIFGQRGVEILDEVFNSDGPLSMDRRTEQTFSRLTAASGSSDTNKNITEQNGRLDRWLDRLGYLANYRNFGQDFPVKFTGRRESIEFEASGRLYDLFPGEENDHGAVTTLHGTKYLVNDVRGSSTPLTEISVCNNEECDRPFQSYPPGETECPHCGTELEETKVHGISSVECKTAMGGQRGYSTRALMSTYVSETDASQKTEDVELFGLPAEVNYGQQEVTDFVYAFERRHTNSPDKTILRSEALIERESSSSTEDQSWEEMLEDVEEEVYRPVGQQYHTQGVTVRFERDAFEERYERTTHDTKSWPQALVSLQQALEKAIAIVAECDRSDFRVKAMRTANTVDVHIVDSRQGGNGVTWQVLQSLSDLEARVVEVADCDRCVDYCDECLLLARTPAYYLEKDLLDRRMLAATVGKDEAEVESI